MLNTILNAICTSYDSSIVFLFYLAKKSAVKIFSASFKSDYMQTTLFYLLYLSLSLFFYHLYTGLEVATGGVL